MKGFSLGRVLTDDCSAVALTAAEITLLQQSGAGRVRVELRCSRLHPTWDATLLSNYRIVCDQLVGAGLKIVALLDPALVAYSNQTEWNTNNTENNVAGTVPTNPFVDAFVEDTAEIALALGDRVDTWEIWNEPNAWTTRSGTVYTGSSYIYPSVYATLLLRTASLLHALWPTCTVASGGLFGHDNGGVLSPTNSGAVYMDALCQQLAARGAGQTQPWPFDVAGQHLYLDQSGLTSPTSVTLYLDYLSQVLARYAGAPSAIIVTEAGWTTQKVTSPMQAWNLQALYAGCAERSVVTAVLWFLLRDNTAANLYFGVVGDLPGLTPKAAFAAYQGV